MSISTAGDSQFCNLTARQALTGPPNNWVITDGGVDPECEEPFITTWSVSGDREIVITTVDDDDSQYNYFVHWGDDSADHTQYTGNASHIYAAAGTYTISIFGEFPRIRFTKPLGTRPNGTVQFLLAHDSNRIRTIKSWGNTAWASMEYAFAQCRNLTIESGRARRTSPT